MAYSLSSSTVKSWQVGAEIYASNFRRYWQAGSIARWRLIGPVPERLHQVPIDVRPRDPLVARDYYQGHFGFAGASVSTGGESPFAVNAPSAAWRDELHGFSWLRHLAAANTDLAVTQARALIEDWINLWGNALRSPTYEGDVVARRVISWMQHASFFSQDSDTGFYRRFLTSLSRQVRFLRLRANGYPEGIGQLQVRIAIAMASMVLTKSPRFQARATHHLVKALDDQILADGGHKNRNPEALAALLVDLVPLAQLYAKSSRPVPQPLVGAIDRMFPRLRALRHGDGNFALFNGAANRFGNDAAAVLRLDGTIGRAANEALQSGYERLESRTTLVIADVGTIPRGAYGAQCHAGALAFELSDGRDRLVVNLGSDQAMRANLEMIARATVAHSTLSIDEQSSVVFHRFSKAPPKSQIRAVSAPSKLEKRPWPEQDAGQGFVAKHDGYAARFGVLHERGILVADGGDRVDGFDRLIACGRRADFDEAVVRFHLHPRVEARHSGHKSGVTLFIDGLPRWFFSTDCEHLSIEPSYFLAGTAGGQNTSQIVLSMGSGEKPSLAWRFERVHGNDNL